MSQYALMKAPFSTGRGKGKIAHELQAYTDNGRPIKGRREIVEIGYEELKSVMEMPHDTQAQQRDKNLAYRDLISEQLPVTWDKDALDRAAAGDVGSVDVAKMADDYLRNVLKRKYPMMFPAVTIEPDTGDED